jgi:hypothetical protein
MGSTVIRPCLRPVFGALTLVIGMTACDDPVICTLIGCTDGVLVHLRGELPSNYTVVVEVPGSADAWVLECTPDSPCPESIEVPYEMLGIPARSPDLMPKTARVTVEAELDTKSEEFELAYEPLYPNGQRCPPACHQAPVVFEW